MREERYKGNETEGTGKTREAERNKVLRYRIMQRGGRGSVGDGESKRERESYEYRQTETVREERRSEREGGCDREQYQNNYIHTILTVLNPPVKTILGRFWYGHTTVTAKAGQNQCRKPGPRTGGCHMKQSSLYVYIYIYKHVLRLFGNQCITF